MVKLFDVEKWSLEFDEETERNVKKRMWKYHRTNDERINQEAINYQTTRFVDKLLLLEIFKTTASIDHKRYNNKCQNSS